MARDKTDKTDLTPAATPATSATNAPKLYNRGKDGTHPLDKSFKPRPEGVVEELGGDELQKLRVTWSNEISLFAEGDFWRDLEAILANCDEIMLRHGWDRKAGNGRDFPGNRTAEPFSELWYAGKIGFECWNLLTWHREHGPNEIALSQALYLGKLLTEAEWRGAFGPSIRTGRKQRRNLSDLRETQNRHAQAGVTARRDAIVAMLLNTNRTGGSLTRWIRQQLVEQHEITVSERTIRDDLKVLQQ
jgi:hypothetical protein